MEGLVAQGLQKWFKTRKVVDNVSLDIQRGEVVGLLGPNGAGKTTSFYMMVGLLPTEGGRIFLEGQEITALPMYQRCRMGVGYLPQESSVFRKLTVEENLLAILETLDLTVAERRSRARDLLAELDLTALAPYPAFTRSCRPPCTIERSCDRKIVMVSPLTTLSSCQTRALPSSTTRCSRSWYSARRAVPVRQSRVMMRTAPVDTVRRMRSPRSSR